MVLPVQNGSVCQAFLTPFRDGNSFIYAIRVFSKAGFICENNNRDISHKNNHKRKEITNDEIII